MFTGAIMTNGEPSTITIILPCNKQSTSNSGLDVSAESGKMDYNLMH